MNIKKIKNSILKTSILTKNIFKENEIDKNIKENKDIIKKIELNKNTNETKTSHKKNETNIEEKLKSLSKKSILKENTLKKANLREKEYENYKKKCLNYSIIISLFVLLFAWLYLYNILLSFGITLIFFIIIFLISINIPIIKHKKYTKKLENDLSFFLTNLIIELRVGKDLLSAIKKCSLETESTDLASKEYAKIIDLIDNGLSFREALTLMNNKFNSLSIKRTNSNLYNIYQHGNDIFGLKKFSDELFLRQRIESKEFGGKLVVFALVFIAVSAIVPAMFASFIIIGSYFMQIQFSAIQIFLILVIVFPSIDLLVLITINSKTPLFLRK
ncbi:MAG: hypothetical protein PHX27_04125 [Candidatus ainarchaeum sp.]|nr:hypothetical protein [Candidatus ainarchaeum sp.]